MERDPEAEAARSERGGRKVLRGRKERGGRGRKGGQGGARAQGPGGGRTRRAPRWRDKASLGWP